MIGTKVIASALKSQGLEIVFGIVGVPVTPLAAEMQNEGIKFVAMHNEQAASYAASCVGYLQQKPAACLTVAGPGMVHALAGLLNANANCWPMVLISSAVSSDEANQGGFQEAPQLEAARPYVKYAARIESLSRVGYYVEQAFRSSVYGRPGAVYLEIPRSLIEGTLNEPLEKVLIGHYPPPPKSFANPEDVEKASKLLQDSEKPLVIIGRGAAYSRAEAELLSFVEKYNIPFLPSPMGKGVISDTHSKCVSAARSVALAEADVILLVGARLNWMFHYGGTPFGPNPKIIQVDISPEQIHHNRQSEVVLMGDAKTVVKQLNDTLGTVEVKQRKQWWEKLETKCVQNAELVAKKIIDSSNPMKYHYVLTQIKNKLPDNVIIINEGANTMDIGRLILTNHYPRSRLDAGTLGTMGLGVGYAIAAAMVEPNRKVVAIQGDSAFGFSGMEVEVACRYNLPITFIILNNNGIYQGLNKLETHDPLKLPATALTPNSHFEKIMEAFGGKGYYVETSEKLSETLTEALSHKGPSLVNIMIDTSGPTPSIVANKNKH